MFFISNYDNISWHIWVLEPCIVIGLPGVTDLGHNTCWQHFAVTFPQQLPYPAYESSICYIPVDPATNESVYIYISFECELM